jgi:hypothetical protein
MFKISNIGICFGFGYFVLRISGKAGPAGQTKQLGLYVFIRRAQYIPAADNDDIDLAAELGSMPAVDVAQHATGTVAVYRTVTHLFTGNNTQPKRRTLAFAKPKHHKTADKALFLCKSLPE